jgi:putative ABC transport system ATP-binding protein
VTDFFAVPTRPVPLPVEPVIELTGVTKVYASGSLEVAALRGIDLRVEQGAYLAIMGPSGSGKSTLMNILGCLDLPTGGIYRLAGEDVGTLGEEQLAHIRNRRIGFVFQQFHLLAGLSDHRPAELSGGQQQRCAVARAVVTEPAMVLADEPTGNLDTASSADVLGLLDELSAAGSTIVLITHEKDVGDRAGAIVHIRDGLLEGPSVVPAVASR